MVDTYEQAKELRRKADETDEDFAKCIHGEVVFWMEDERTRVPGHIATKDGMMEFQISRCCEYHFDLMFAEDEDDMPDPRGVEEFSNGPEVEKGPSQSQP